VLASIIYGATAIATGVQLWCLMSWAIWGAPINPFEYIGLLGSVVLFAATVSGLRRHNNVHRIALCGLLLLWPFYALLMYATWLNPDGSFTFKTAIVDSVPAAMLLGASISSGIQFSASWRMKPDEARHLVIEGINYAAYHETDFSLQDSDKNRLFGTEHYDSSRPVNRPSPWAEGNFEEKMAMLLVWANVLNRSVPAFAEAQKLLESEDSIVGRIIRISKNRNTSDIVPGPQWSPKTGQ
jgi:hypothetical protein